MVEAQNRWLPTFGWDIVKDPLEADLVCTHAGNQADIPATIPLVHHCHGLYWYGFEWQKWALKMNRDVIKSMRRADVATAPSKWVAHAIARGTNINAPVLYHGIEPDEWAEEADHGQYVVWNKTRVDPICDPRDMLRLAQAAPDVQFATTIFWSLDESPAPNIKVTGVVPPDQAKDLVRHAGVYLCTTRETFGIGTLEAMAAGVPVLGWDWGGQSEIVTHKITGWLAPPGDYRSLEEGLRYCLANRETMGARARSEALEEWTWNRAIQRYDALYRQLLARPESPRVSVVIPAYNMEATLGDTVASVVTQTYNNYEIVIVDDASTDSTGHIADGMAVAHPNLIRVVHNLENQYLAEALNVGIRSARGRYIVPLDADNMFGSPDSLALLAQALDTSRDISIAYGSMSVIQPGKDEWVSGWPADFEYRRQMKHQNQIPSTSMYRKSIWERVGGYRRRCRTAEDADFWCRATSFGGNAKKVTDAVILRYRDREDSMSHVNQDWPWHVWYPWGRKTDMTPWIAPVDDEPTQPFIPMHEFSMVSVVIPVGPGHGRLVLDALDSIRSQTFPWWEAVVVNDTGHPLRDIPPWAHVVDTDGSVGAGAARNLGMSVARGDLFTFLDADDYFQPEALELMVVEQHRTKGFVYTDWYKQESGEIYHAPEWDGCDSVLSQLPWPVTCLYPRKVWDDVGRFDTDLPAWEDWDFAIRVVEAGYCGTRLAVPLFHYRIGSGARREAGYADRENLKQEIFNRWSKYITKEIKMPCGCSGGGGLPSLPALDLYAQTATPQPSSANGTDGAELIEYIGDAAAPITYSGQVTGTKYRFGSDSGHKVRWVYTPDVPRFLDFSEFRRYTSTEASPALAAAGPPR